MCHAPKSEIRCPPAPRIPDFAPLRPPPRLFLPTQNNSNIVRRQAIRNIYPFHFSSFLRVDRSTSNNQSTRPSLTLGGLSQVLEDNAASIRAISSSSIAICSSSPSVPANLSSKSDLSARSVFSLETLYSSFYESSSRLNLSMVVIIFVLFPC